MPLWRFALATFPPTALLLAAALYGGWFGALALIWLTLLAAGMDQILARPIGTGAHVDGTDLLSGLLALGHLALIPASAYAFGQEGRSWGAHLTLFFGAASYMGQVSHPNAHELIHRAPRVLRQLGIAVYTSMLFGHHNSAHRLVHHAHVGTPRDPNTPLAGEGFWAYLPRAWMGSFRAGLIEERRRSTGGRVNPYLTYVIGGLASLLLALLLGGVTGALWFLALAGLAALQILLSDYIQHYGLFRRTLASGRTEPVAAHHSWNAPRGFTTFLMVNAPSHSDHHMHPRRPYDALVVPDGAPMLPYSMPIMAMIATSPRHWRRMMDKRAAKVMARG